jgi:hypothetical protein
MMEGLLWKLFILIGSAAAFANRDTIYVRSHGQTQEPAQERTLEAVLGLNIVPKTRLRFRTRGPKEAAETLEAAGSAAFKAIHQQHQSIVPAAEPIVKDLHAVESSLQPVRIQPHAYRFWGKIIKKSSSRRQKISRKF